MNGNLVGYYGGGKGIRQTDPLSPYLLVLVMEAFNKIVQAKVEASQIFKYHPTCSGQKLTHLCFADDLLLFASADLPSILIFQEALQDFKQFSGLSVNQSKSGIYCSAVSPTLNQQILTSMQFRPGTHPIKYLGMPLISGKLTLPDHNPLIERKTSRLNSWTGRKLSFSGTLLSLQSVMYGIQSYRSSIFILPKKVIKVIEQRFKFFLWKGVEENKGNIKVAWDQLRFPKREGGLKKIEDWNKEAVMKHIWSLSAQAGSLWLAWVYDNLLKSKCFWSVKCP